jgi:membrane peptidoglycan carboxypeptidase
MTPRPAPLHLPSIRTLLLRIHRDLFKVDKFVRSWTPRDALSTVEILILILEDRRFFEHRGVDWRSCVRELFRAITWQRFGGASTIDMQFVRTATGFSERTLRRKIYELLLASLVQYRYSKIEILRAYLGCAFFGSHLYGIDSASRAMFDKAPQDLELNEAAEVASLLVYPRPLIPTAPWRLKVSRRADYAKALFPRLEQRFKKLPSWEEF